MFRRLIALSGLLLCCAGGALYVRRHRAPQRPVYPPATALQDASSAPQDTYQVVASSAHDRGAFTEGLVWSEGGFYESTGLNGQSNLRRVAFPSGIVTKQTNLDQKYFGEGLALFDDTLVQLTWQNHVGFTYDKATFKPQKTFPVSTEGWGLTYDGKQLVMSDGSDRLFFLDPQTLKVTRQVKVTWDGTTLKNINELEYINGEVWANVWQSNYIVRIDPATGHVNSYLDLTQLAQAQTGNVDVLNGIAYDAKTGRIFVTGKLWPKIYVIKVSGAQA